MKLAVELYSEKPLFIKENSFFKLGLRIKGLVLDDTVGIDQYGFANMALTGRRIGGTAREIIYDHSIFPSGFGSGEARPGAYVHVEQDSVKDMAVVLETNLILDMGMLRDSVGLRLVNEAGKSYDVPLARPDIEIAWDGRGRYVIPVGEFLTSKLFSA